MYYLIFNTLILTLSFNHLHKSLGKSYPPSDPIRTCLSNHLTFLWGFSHIMYVTAYNFLCQLAYYCRDVSWYFKNYTACAYSRDVQRKLSNYLAECLVHFCASHFESILHRLSSVAGYIDSIHHEIATSVLPFVLFRQIKSNLIMLKAQYSAEVEMCWNYWSIIYCCDNT